MNVQEVLGELDLGNSVAEFDQDLERYFLETDVFRVLAEARADIITGDKGTGKTALYKYLERRSSGIPALFDVEIITGFNLSGSPVFQRLAYTGPLVEGQYITVWKTYILSLVGNWLLQFCEGECAENTRKLDTLLNQIGLRSEDDTAITVFSRLTSWIQRLSNPRTAGVEVRFDSSGIPIFTPRLEFSSSDQEIEQSETDFILHDDALHLLNSALAENGITVWVALDRLDEAFVGFSEVEVPALRALLRTYLDLLAFERIRLKLFIRKDLFRKIISDRFVNLTHVNARRREIIWDEEDLFTLVCKRIRENEGFLRLLDVQHASDQELFDIMFPKQVDIGERRPTTWRWMLSRTMDGSGSISPRNLIDLANKAKEEQLRREQRSPRLYADGTSLIEAEAVKRAFTRLSEERVEDTLLAEASEDVAVLIKAFKGNRITHNDASIAKLFGVEMAQAKAFANTLLDVGFFERSGEVYRIAQLYREGLSIMRGRAF